MTGHRLAGKIETKDRRGREGVIAIFRKVKIADFPGLCVASLRALYVLPLIKIKVVGQSDQPRECSQTDERTDRWTLPSTSSSCFA